MFSIHTKAKSPRFHIPPAWRETVSSAAGILNFDHNLIYYFNRWSPLLSQHFYRVCHTVEIQMTLTIAVLIHSLFKPMGRIYSTWKGDVSFCANTRHGCNPSSVSFFFHSQSLELPLESFTYRFLNPFSRFVADVPLASTKTSNYYNAISMALKLLTDMQNNRDTHVSSVNHDAIQ